MSFLPVANEDGLALYPIHSDSFCNISADTGRAMRRLTPNQRVVIEALAAEVKRTGVSPTHARLVELCPTVPRGSIASTVNALARRGYIAKSAYNNSPIKPLMDANGEAITIRAVWGDKPGLSTSDGGN